MIAIIDYGMGNLKSVHNAFKFIAPQIETIVTDPDGTLRYTYVITLKVNGDNLVGSSSDEGDDKVIGDGLIGGTIYNGNLDLDFTNCEIEYII